MERCKMTFSWTPVILVDIFGSVLTLCIAILCANSSWRWLKRKTDDIFRQYIFLLTLSIVFFAISRSFGHLIKQILLLNDMPAIWSQIAPFSGAINSAIFIIIFAFGIYFHRVQKVHVEIEKYRKNLESLVIDRTAQLKESNRALQNEIGERTHIENELRQSNITLENVLESSSPLCITNVNFEIIKANKAYLETWPKKSHKEGEKIKCFESRPGSLCHTDGCPLQQVIDGKEEVTLESVKYEFRGKPKTFIISARPFRDTYGNLIGIVESFQDISARIRAETAKVELIDDLQEALDKVNLLTGMLPICASCKKIRDDKGYWNQIEIYIRDHSEAEFSHGICPDCAKKLYPEFYTKDDRVISDKQKE
jgi:PAS domain-containing protein